MDKKQVFNALQNAEHIFSFEQNKTAFKVISAHQTDDSAKYVVVTQDGEIMGLYTDSPTAIKALNEVLDVFGDECPYITVKLKQSKSGVSLYTIEVQ